MTATITSLTELAQTYLDVCEAALATTTAGAPASVYLSPAQPAFDCCPALIVHVLSLSEEPTSPQTPSGATGRRTLYGSIILAQLVATALRCAPKPQKDGSVLSTDIEAVATEVQQDGWALWNGIQDAIKHGTFKDLCSIVHFDRAQVIPEQGGCVGWQMVVRAQIDGIPVTAPGT